MTAIPTAIPTVCTTCGFPVVPSRDRCACGVAHCYACGERLAGDPEERQ